VVPPWEDDGRFEVEVDIDNAKRGSKWRVTPWHDGRRYHHKVHTANRGSDIEIEKKRPNTKGKDVFKLRVKRLSAAGAATRRSPCAERAPSSLAAGSEGEGHRAQDLGAADGHRVLQDGGAAAGARVDRLAGA
jgi:hypothetical protein